MSHYKKLRFFDFSPWQSLMAGPSSADLLPLPVAHTSAATSALPEISVPPCVPAVAASEPSNDSDAMLSRRH